MMNKDNDKIKIKNILFNNEFKKEIVSIKIEKDDSPLVPLIPIKLQGYNKKGEVILEIDKEVLPLFINYKGDYAISDQDYDEDIWEGIINILIEKFNLNRIKYLEKDISLLENIVGYLAKKLSGKERNMNLKFPFIEVAPSNKKIDYYPIHDGICVFFTYKGILYQIWKTGHKAEIFVGVNNKRFFRYWEDEYMWLLQRPPGWYTEGDLKEEEVNKVLDYLIKEAGGNPVWYNSLVEKVEAVIMAVL